MKNFIFILFCAYLIIGLAYCKVIEDSSESSVDNEVFFFTFIINLINNLFFFLII
jgi:hypothetical protein